MRLIPQQARADRDREPPGMREIGRFIAGDSVGAFFSLIMISLLPVMVAVRFDAAHNAFFYTAYTVGGTMEFMAINMASSLTAHASHSPESLAEGVRGALRRMVLLLVPVVLVLVVFAPLILAPFGQGYQENGSTVLRLLAAAALPRVAVELYIGVLRVQGRTGMLAVLQGAMCVLVLGSAAVLLGPYGISGAGFAVLGAMTLMAVACVPGLRATLKGRTCGRATPGGGPGEGARGGRLRHQLGPGERLSARGARVGDSRPSASPCTYPGRVTTSPAGPLARPLPTPVSRPEEPDAPDRWGTWLWLALGLAAGLFWFPLARSGELDVATLSGTGLLAALPRVTLGAGLLLVALQGAAVGLRFFRPVFAAVVLLATFLALHTAPPLLGLQ